MKLLRLFRFATLICLFFASQAMGQSPLGMLHDSDQRFDATTEYGSRYFDSLATTGSTQNSHDAKVFGRWASFWNSRIDPDSNGLNGYDRAIAWHARLLNGDFQVCSTSPQGSQWRSLGPENALIDQYFENNIGIVNAVAWHPTDINTIYIGTNFGGVWKTTDLGQHWVNTTDQLRLPIMAVHALALEPGNPNVIYAGTGETTHNSVMFGLGLFKSTNGGSSWQRIWPSTISLPGDRHTVNVIRFHPNFQSNGIMFIAGGPKIYRSNNFGQSFTEVYDATNQLNGSKWHSFFDLEFLPGNPNVLMASTRFKREHIYSQPPSPLRAAQLVKSMDGGITWDCMTCDSIPPPPFSHAERYAIAPSIQDQSLVVLFSSYHAPSHSFENGKFVKTIDGQTFRLKMDARYGGIGFDKAELVISPNDTNKIWVGNITFNTYIPGNDSFAGMPLHVCHFDMRATEYRNYPPASYDRILLATDGGPALYRSDNNSYQSLLGEGLAITQFYGFDFYPSTGDIAAGTQDNGLFARLKGEWHYKDLGDAGWVEIDNHLPNDAFYGYMGGFNDGEWKLNTNHFASFGLANSTFSPGDLQQPTFLERRIFSDPSRPRVFYAGDNWWLKKIDLNQANPAFGPPLFQRTILDQRHHLQDMGMSAADSNVMYIAYNPSFYGQTLVEGLLVSRDAGQTWQDITANLRETNLASAPVYNWRFVTDIEVDPEDAGHLYVGVSGYGWDDNANVAEVRVFESKDYGQSWRRMSRGLTPFPVNYLCYQNGSNGVLYAATDGGIFRYDPLRDYWDCFNNGLPSTTFTRVLIDYCRGKVIASSFGRGMWEADLPSSTSQHHISASQTWAAGTVRYFANDVVVDPGTVLTIRGKVSFAAGKRLIVRRGAKLRLLGGLLTNDCGELWEGVDVEGHVSRNQIIMSNGLANFQGIVEVNGGTIEHARTGISTSLHDSQGYYFWNSFGGIIQCSNAKFLNNKRDVEFLSYANRNLSYFRNCRFETTDSLPNQESPTTHVSMWNVRGIPFEGCLFKHADTTGYTYAQRGAGIVAVDATYFVDWKCNVFGPNGCTGGVPTRFEGLYYGIHQENSNPLLSPSVRHSQFIRNKYKGAMLRNTDFAIIEDNYFDVGSEQYATGLYLWQCSKYRMQGNSFNTTVSGSPQRYGLIVHDGGDDANYIYNNSFSNLPYALSAQEDNEGPNLQDGLIMNCNDFTNCGFGIMALGTVADAGVGETQGYDANSSILFVNAAALVRNRYWGQCSGANENKFLMAFPNQFPILHQSNLNSECQPLPHPSCSDWNLEVVPTTILFDKVGHCPIKGPSNSAEIKPQINMASNRLAQVETNFSGLLDGGDTPARLAYLSGNHSPGQVLNQLLNHSPYLSDTVLQAAVRFGLPNGSLREILLMNSPLSPKVMDAVRGLSLPQGILSQIESAQNGTSARQLLENEMASARNDLDFWQDEAIRHWLHDSVPMEDSLLAALVTYNYADCYKKHTLALEGDATASDLALQGALDCNVKNPSFDLLLQQARGQSKQCCLLDDAPGAVRPDPATNQYVQAQASLDQAMAWRSHETHLLPPNVSNKEESNTEGVFEGPSESAKVFPNPAHHMIYVELVESVDESWQFELFGLDGKILLKQDLLGGKNFALDVAHLPTGLFIYRLSKGGTPCKSGKIQLN